MSALRPDVDPDGLLEYSVVYTDRALNHMSRRFGEVMRDLHALLAGVYRADHVVVVPGGGSFAMEAVARQLARGRRCLIVRNGWFSYRWSQILAAGAFAATETVLRARAVAPGPAAPFAPPPIEELVATIERERPEIVFAPHVETSAGLILPDDYLAALGEAARAVGALFVLDCVASGATWVDMRAAQVDVLISAPQKGWSGPPCAGLVMLGERAVAALEASASDSFALDLAQWSSIMRAYLAGGHAYHATMPTDALARARDAMRESERVGFETLRERQAALGARVRAALGAAGFASVAAAGFEAPSVVVCHTASEALSSGRAFAAEGVQIAAGVPLSIGEPESFRSFRIGLFGLDKLVDVDAAVARFEHALERVLAGERGAAGAEERRVADTAD